MIAGYCACLFFFFFCGGGGDSCNIASSSVSFPVAMMYIGVQTSSLTMGRTEHRLKVSDYKVFRVWPKQVHLTGSWFT
jgi:hypothetical protein